MCLGSLKWNTENKSTNDSHMQLKGEHKYKSGITESSIQESES